VQTTSVSPVASKGYYLDMATVVIVASSEIPRTALGEVVAAEDALHVVVPAVEQSRLQWLANDEGDARERAEEVGAEIADAADAPATVDVKPDEPHQVVKDAIAEHAPDRVVVALREGEDATWLEEGELAELPDEIDGVPVTRITIP
jgi:hypothetical protein